MTEEKDNPFASLVEELRQQLAETQVPDDLAAAGKVLEGVTPGPWNYIESVSDDGQQWLGCGVADAAGREFLWQEHSAEDDIPLTRFIAWCREGVPAILARIAAQEAQIKGLTEANRELGMQSIADLGQAQEAYEAQKAAETALAAMTKERDELRASIAWVDEVYPERIEAGGAGIQITWEEFNAMQAAIGVTVDKRIGGPEGKAVHNQRLRAALAAEKARVAGEQAAFVRGMEAALDMIQSMRASEGVVIGRDLICTALKSAITKNRAAITEASK